MPGAEDGSASASTTIDAGAEGPTTRAPWWQHDPMLALEVSLVGLFVVLAWRLQWIADDGYIYLTHVQNWVANGAGPNLNPGEPVEGYTSVAWIVVLALGDLLRPDRLLTLEQLTILVGMVLSTAAAAAWIPIERSAIATTVGADHLDSDDRPATRWVFDVPLILFATSYVVRSYATSGLETPLIMVWVVAVVWAVWTRHRNPFVLALLAGSGPLVRPEFALISLGLVAMLVLDQRARPAEDRIGARGAFGLAALVVVPALLTEIVRIGYYGQLLPNTYYAKTGTSHGWSDGWTYLRDAADPHRWWWILVVSVVVAVAVPVWRRRRSGGFHLAPADHRRWTLLAFSVVLASAAMRSGGDFMHGRTLLPAFVMLLGSLSGAASVAVGRLDPSRRSLRPAVVLGLTVVLVAVQLPLTSRQDDTDRLVIGDIADELRFWETRDANAHSFSGENLDPLAQMGRDLAALSDRLDAEIGVAVGALGMTSYFAQRDGARVYVYDVAGLTRPDVARVETADETRVGHARRATEPMVVLDRRVDFASLSFDGFDEAFTVRIGSTDVVLISFDLIRPLIDADLIDGATVDRMTTYLTTRLAADDVDPDLVQLLVWRPFPDPAVADRVAELADTAASSAWADWARRTADERALLEPDDCGGFADCLRRALDAHRADEIPFLPPGALAPPG